MEQSFLVQFRHHRIYAAGFIQVFYVGRPCRCQVAEVRGLFADSIRKVNLKIHADLMGDRRKVQHAVGRAAQSHIYRQGVEDGILCHNVSWTDILLPQFHDLHACLLRETDPCRVDCRNGSVAAKSHAKHFRQAVHAVGRVHAGTGSAGRTGLILEFLKIIVRDQARRVGSNCLKHAGKAGLLSLDMACQHRAAAYEYGRYIDSGCRHQKSRHILVTVGYHDQGVKLVRQSHGFRGIRNQVSGYQRIFHADMSHGDPVAYGDGRKYDRRSACHGNPLLHCIYNLIQVHMPWHDLIIRTDNSNQRPLHLLRRQAQGVQQ